MGVGERERTSHDIHVGADRGRPSLRREFVDILRQLGRPTFVAAWRSYGAALLEQIQKLLATSPRSVHSIPIFISASRSRRRSPTQGCE